MVTGLYTALLAILLVVLSFRVIALRGAPYFRWFAFGHNDNVGLKRAIRGHSNLIEYAPIFLLLMLTAELNGLSANALHNYGFLFFFARMMHGLCFGFLKHNMILRVTGTVMTMLAILGLATVCVTSYLS